MKYCKHCGRAIKQSEIWPKSWIDEYGFMVCFFEDMSPSHEPEES